jgi:diadenosine tetraphosphate (Ap4A) HIT family hydrolase
MTDTHNKKEKDLSCVFCSVAQDKNQATFIAEMPHSVAVLNFDQTNYPGRCLVILKNHQTDMLALPKNLRETFNDEAMKVAQAVQKVFGPERINYCNLGNEVPHLHWHIIPRYKGGPNEGRPPWPASPWKKLEDGEYREIAAKLRQALQI